MHLHDRCWVGRGTESRDALQTFGPVPHRASDAFVGDLTPAADAGLRGHAWDAVGRCPPPVCAAGTACTERAVRAVSTVPLANTSDVFRFPRGEGPTWPLMEADVGAAKRRLTTRTVSWVARQHCSQLDMEAEPGSPTLVARHRLLRCWSGRRTPAPPASAGSS